MDGIIRIGYSRILRRIIGSYVISPITNPTRSDLESKPLFRDEQPATNCLSHGTVQLRSQIVYNFFVRSFPCVTKQRGLHVTLFTIMGLRVQYVNTKAKQLCKLSK